MTATFTDRVIELTNKERVSRGLVPLALNSQLSAAAQNHSQNMANQDFFSHTGNDGSTVSSRVTVTGYQWSRVAENIAAGQTTPETVVTAWMNSPGHRANILNPDLREIGVGYFFLANDTGNVNFNHYWTQVFGTSRNPSPTPAPLAPEIAVFWGNTNIQDGAPTPIDFGSTTIGEPLRHTLLIQNTGTGVLNLTRVEIPANLTIVGNIPTTIPANSSANLTFQWDGNSSFQEEIRLFNNDSDENPFNFFVKATIQPRQIRITKPQPLTPPNIPPQVSTNVIGTIGNDFLIGTERNDIILAMEGNDRVWGGDGADDLNGNTGDDVIDGQWGNDTFLRGGQGNDTIFGGSGDDLHVNGNKGNDFILGGTGNDTLFGGQGDDTIYGEEGNDVLYGNLGRDLFVLELLPGIDVISDFTVGEDLIGLYGINFSDISIVASQSNSLILWKDIILAKLIGIQPSLLQQDLHFASIFLYLV